MSKKFWLGLCVVGFLSAMLSFPIGWMWAVSVIVDGAPSLPIWWSTLLVACPFVAWMSVKNFYQTVAEDGA